MAGVEVLAIEEVATAYAFNWKAYLLTFTVVLVIMTIVGFILNHSNGMDDFLICLMCGVIFGAILGLLPAWTTLPKEYETQYKVTISDEVSMNDFLEKYEIVDQEGKIYTVREAGAENDK